MDGHMNKADKKYLYYCRECRDYYPEAQMCFKVEDLRWVEIPHAQFFEMQVQITCQMCHTQGYNMISTLGLKNE